MDVFSWRLKVLTESSRQSGDGSLFHARRVDTGNERPPSDDVVRGTATEPDVADLRPALAVAVADSVMKSANCFVSLAQRSKNGATTPSRLNFDKLNKYS